MELKSVLPRSVRPFLPERFEEGLEEIRIRAGGAAELVYGDFSGVRLCRIREDEIVEMLNYLSDYSPYAIEEELKEGFFTIEGGHRVGVAGRANRTIVGTEAQVDRITDIGAFNIRVAHEVKDCAKALLPFVRDEHMHNVILTAGPGIGKTTVLRDLIRLLSMGDETHPGLKVGVVDERSEIAACYLGIPQNDLGPRTDVLDNFPKKKGMQMLLRTMSPQVIAVDELGGKDEFAAVRQIIFSGCHLLATVHARHAGELLEKPFLKELLEDGMIDRLIEITREESGGRRFLMYDSKLAPINTADAGGSAL